MFSATNANRSNEIIYLLITKTEIKRLNSYKKMKRSPDESTIIIKEHTEA